MTEAQKELFNSRSPFRLLVPLSDISHYTTMAIHWQALKENITTRDQWIAYHMIGYEYVNNQLHLILTIKSFNEEDGAGDQDEPLRYCLPEGWQHCDYTSE